MWGSTPPKAIVARIKVSSSSSPRMASWRCLGVMRLTFRSLAAFCYEGCQLMSQVLIESRCQASVGRGDRREETYARKFKDLGSEIFQHGRDIDCCLGADAHLVLSVLLEEALDTTTGELGQRSTLA